MCRSIFLLQAHVLLLAPAILFLTSCENEPGPNVVGIGTRYVNNAGGLKTVSLPDGSQVLLMEGTVISVSKGFGKEGRDVDIDGKALLYVKAGRGQPFVVHTGNLIIEVQDTTGAVGGGAEGWGACFAVDAVRKQAGEEADLLDGRLRVTKSYHSDTDSLPEELGAGDMVMINREIDLMEKEKMTGEEEGKVKEQFNVAGQ